MAGSQYLKGNSTFQDSEDNWDADSVESAPEDFSQCEKRPEFVFDNGARYSGQWSGNMRHGFGVQVWPDGARYEGYWKKNKAHGKGTFWHVYGDRYEGNWKRDKAHGFGKYTHSNGATYEGQWKNDL